MPFAYLAREREFYGRSFNVDDRVLIPRPETEHLVETTGTLNPAPQRILDLGTGSGCIAISLALEHPSTTVVAADISVSALAVAQGNARKHDLQEPRFSLVASDLNHGLDITAFDTIVSNPPYIADSDALPDTVAKFEPHSALFAGTDGLAFYQRLLGPNTPLVRAQRIVLEVGAGQRAAIEAIAEPLFEGLAVRFRSCRLGSRPQLRATLGCNCPDTSEWPLVRV